MGSPLISTLVNAFLLYFEKIGYKYDHLTVILITNGGMMMISLLCLPHQNI